MQVPCASPAPHILTTLISNTRSGTLIIMVMGGGDSAGQEDDSKRKATLRRLFSGWSCVTSVPITCPTLTPRMRLAIMLSATTRLLRSSQSILVLYIFCLCWKDSRLVCIADSGWPGRACGRRQQYYTTPGRSRRRYLYSGYLSAGA